MSETCLEKINSPADLKALSVAELEQLAGEIRQFILNSVSKTGGHLASNLGAVELTLALHHVFDFQRDKLLWDVGHQCYTHKIVTGRKAGFDRLRHAGGNSGFPNPAESDQDQFTVGHAGTSVATAIGMALGEQLKTAREQGMKDSTGSLASGLPTPASPPRPSPRIVALVGDAS
ncbi:MAG: 1-deoxy-D-xylulose-5-phosphate synthase N-terminal domain-containing protein, partial [Phycisphaerales bacterium]